MGKQATSLERRGIRRWGCGLIVLLTSLLMTGGLRAEPFDFAGRVAPLLVEHCVRCHSQGLAQGEFSLATPKDALSQGYLVAGDADSSYLVDVVTSRDGQPPLMPHEGTPLNAEQVAVLRDWVNSGAPWPEGLVLREKSKADANWWSLQPLRPVAPPESADIPANWAAHPIDRFIHAGLAERGLSPAPRAEERVLYRRLHFTLLGLPPIPEEVTAFVEDETPDKWARLVDRLLDSPHYGERLAQHWLDIAHYADTHGFERDQRRDQAWHYRDYVIRAFNEDKPYDRFLREQIAGDILAPDQPESVIATGFLAAGPWDYVGQVETKSPELRRAARALDLDDMVTQVFSATVGMTVNCARCHDHKLDPISQQEYYQATALLAGLKRAERVVSSAEEEQYRQAQAKLDEQLTQLRRALHRWERTPVDLADLVGGGDGSGSGRRGTGIDLRSGRPQQAPLSALNNLRPGELIPVEYPGIEGVFVPASEGETALSGTGLRFTGFPVNNGQAWDAVRNGPVTSQFSTKLGDVDYTDEGHSLLGLHANAGITFDLQQLSADSPVPLARFSAVVGYGGNQSRPSAEFWVLLDGELLQRGKLGREDVVSLRIALAKGARFLTLVSTDGGDGYSHDQISFGDPRLEFAEESALTESQLQAREQKVRQLREELASREAERRELTPPARFYGVVAESPPPVHVLKRGDPEAPGDAVHPGPLNWGGEEITFGDATMTDAARRKALADWIVDPEHPLTARVIVNRLWSWHFGRGIVETPSDFGYGGGRPSHPELLDWLAAELIRSDWSLKHIQRLMLTSQTFQMTSQPERLAATGEAPLPSEIDSDNRFYWRMNARRMEAEALRDAVLVTTGKLNREMFGPGYRDFDYQEAYAPIYTYRTADSPEEWRRTLYRFVVRTTPNRFLTTLDCPDPANFTPRRHVTTTPLQSLALYNNDFMLRQSRYFAQRLQQEAGDEITDQVHRAFQLVYCRDAQAPELELARSFLEQHGLFAFCRALLNTNEFVYVD